MGLSYDILYGFKETLRLLVNILFCLHVWFRDSVRLMSGFIFLGFIKTGFRGFIKIYYINACYVLACCMSYLKKMKCINVYFGLIFFLIFSYKYDDDVDDDIEHKRLFKLSPYVH